MDAVAGQPAAVSDLGLRLEGGEEETVQVDELALLLGCDLLFGSDVLRQSSVAFGIRVFLDQRGREQNHPDAGLLRGGDHRGDVCLVGCQNVLVVWPVQAVPDVVDPDADGHDGRLQLDHVTVEPAEQVLRLLATDALVDDLGDRELRVLPREHSVDEAKIPAGGGDRIADGHDLLAASDPEPPRRVSGRRARERSNECEEPELLQAHDFALGLARGCDVDRDRRFRQHGGRDATGHVLAPLRLADQADGQGRVGGRWVAQGQEQCSWVMPVCVRVPAVVRAVADRVDRLPRVAGSFGCTGPGSYGVLSFDLHLGDGEVPVPGAARPAPGQAVIERKVDPQDSSSVLRLEGERDLLVFGIRSASDEAAIRASLENRAASTGDRCDLVRRQLATIDGEFAQALKRLLGPGLGFADPSIVFRGGIDRCWLRGCIRAKRSESRAARCDHGEEDGSFRHRHVRGGSRSSRLVLRSSEELSSKAGERSTGLGSGTCSRAPRSAAEPPLPLRQAPNS